MLLGAWKSFTDLEDNLTLDELFALYESILEQEHENFRRQAGIQGVEVPQLEEIMQEKEEQQPRETLGQRIARKRAAQQGKNPNKAAGEAMFGEGIGYKLIGG